MNALIRTPGTGFVIVPPEEIPPDAEMCFVFMAGSFGHGRPAEMVGSFVCALSYDDPRQQTLRQRQGLMNLRYGGNWYQTVYRIVGKKERQHRSQETRLKAALTKIRNKAEARREAIEKSNSLFRTDELAALQQERIEAERITTYNYRHNPNYQR